MSQDARENNLNKTPKKVRRCSLCSEIGHTKRDCLKRPLILKSGSHYRPVPVTIRVNYDVPASKYVVEIPSNEVKHKWDKHISVFEEGKILSKERKVVDFAELIRHEKKSKEIAQDDEFDIQTILSKQNSDKKKNNFASSIRSRISGRITGAAESISGAKKDFIERAKESVKRSANNFSFKKFAFSVSALLAAATLPFPAIGYYRQIKTNTSKIVEESTNAFLSLQSSTAAAFSNNLPQAQFDLNSALNSFSRAEDLIDKEYKALAYVASMLPVVGKEVSSRQHLLLAGHQLALGNTYIIKGVSDASKSPDMYFADRVGIMRHHIEGAIPQYKEALLALEKVDKAVLPAEYQASFKDFKILFTALINDLESTKIVLSGLQTILGDEGFRRYIVVFQNNHELRATGGFMGSFAVLDIQKGKILNIDVPGGGSYDLQGQLDTYLRPPLPLQIANNRWEFQDANWFPDFSASAQKIEWFYQHSRKSTVDGVIAINGSVLERVLRVLGPVYSEKYNLLLNHEQALASLQQYVEDGYDKSVNKPKAVIGDLLKQLMDSVQSIKPEQMINLVSELQSSLEEKEIQFYFNDQLTQKKISQFGWTGELKKTNAGQDYLMVVNTNLGGQKSDAMMEQTIEHESLVREDGSIIDTVILKKNHTGEEEVKFYGAPNIDYLRIYTPAGSELIDAGGFVYPEEQAFLAPEEWYKEDETLKSVEQEVGVDVKTGTRITKEFGKTVFANWIVTKPGESSEVWFRYKIPVNALNNTLAAGSSSWGNFKKLLSGANNEYSRYSLFVQKQSGMKSKFSTQVIYPEGWRPIWKTDDSISLKLNGAEYSADLKTDYALGIAMEKDMDK